MPSCSPAYIVPSEARHSENSLNLPDIRPSPPSKKNDVPVSGFSTRIPSLDVIHTSPSPSSTAAFRIIPSSVCIKEGYILISLVVKSNLATPVLRIDTQRLSLLSNIRGLTPGVEIIPRFSVSSGKNSATFRTLPSLTFINGALRPPVQTDESGADVN